MKRSNTLLLTIAILICLSQISSITFAQNSARTVVVEPDNYPEEIGSLNRAIEDEIAIDPETIFILKRDAVYWLDGAVENEDFKLHIKAEEGEGHPPIIRASEAPTWTRLFDTTGDVHLDGLFINAVQEDGELGYIVFRHSGSNSRVVIDNSWMMHSNGQNIELTGDGGNSIFVTNSVIKNHGRLGGGTVGRVINNDADQDTIYLENNTIHNIQHSLMRNPSHTVGYYHVNHNTIMNVSQYTRIRRAVDMTFTNNLVLNFFTHGMSEGSTGSGIIELSDIDGVNNEDRNLVVSNNNIGYIDQRFLDIIADAGKVPVPVVNTSHAGIVTMEGNIEERVGFVDEPDLDTWEQWALLNEGLITEPDYPVAYDRWLDADNEPAEVHFTTALDRDFTYTSEYASYRAADNGYPVGDLNWFPDLKELWEAGEPAPEPDFISVSTWEELHNIRDDLDGDYVLAADLDEESAGYADYNTGDGWVSIEGFTGTFDGNGHTISGLTSTIGGLFAVISGATVKNLGLVNADISSPTNNAGILVDLANNGALIENCFSTGTLTASARSSHGGLVGRTDEVETTIRGSWSSADVIMIYEGNDGRWTGGLAGYIREGLIEDSYATGNVVSTGENVGGLAGRVGLSSTQGIVKNSYSTGEVSGSDLVGGLLGAIGALEAGSEVVAGFWDTESSGMAESFGGEGLSTAEMKTESTFTDAGWDFTEVWAMDSEINDGYPHLRHAVHVDDPDPDPEPRVVVVEPDDYPMEIGKLNHVIAEEISLQPNTIFELKRDAVYWLDDIITNPDFVLQIRAEEGEGHLPIIRPALDLEGSSNHLFYTNNDAFFDGLFLMAIDESGIARRPIVHQTRGNRIKFHNGYVIGTHDFMIWFSNQDGSGPGNSLFLTNSVFANAGRTDNANQGRLVDTRGNDQDTVWIENSTIYNFKHSFLRTSGSSIDYLHLNHNTAVNIASYIRTGTTASATITNNLFLNFYTNGMAEGGLDGVIEASSAGFDDANRTYVIRNNNIGYLDEVHQQALDSLGLERVPPVDNIIQGWLQPNIGANVEYEGNFEEGVAFADPPDPIAEWSTAWHTTRDMPMVYDRWDEAGSTTDPAPYHYNLDLIRNFSYSDEHQSYYAADNYFPVGDLNWFPELKELWEQGESATPPTYTEHEVLPDNFRLVGNYPNPFNPATNIVYELPLEVEVLVEAYNLLGQRVWIMDLGMQAPGRHEVAFDAGHLSSGVYIIRMQMGENVQTHRVTLIK